ncbi:MAG TPA: Ig-like domain-containing protein [Pyrinomonadaceae bacterium]|nr:Ig-like domain-containing protein [Pyrinomonadaceae bacterium]
MSLPFFGHRRLEFKYSTAPGTVLVTALSVGNRDNQVFRMPMWDVAAQRSPTGGYPWYIDGNSSTSVYIKNASDTTQKYFVQINYAGGVYMIGMKTLGGGETVSYDVRTIRDQQIPDSRGRVIPLNISSGQVHWSANGDGMMIGRSEQADLVAGTSSNYACMNCCSDSPYTDTQRVTPSSATVDTEASSLFTAEEQYQDCYGNFSEFTFVTDATWASSAPSVATVESLNGNVTGAAPGSATITASWHEYVYHYNPATQSCVPRQNDYTKSATITVQCPVPTSETTTFGGWDDADQLGTLAMWNQTLQPTSTNFSGRTVTERDPGGGGPDTCYFNGSIVPEFTHISGGTWPVSSGNAWGTDFIGWAPAAVLYYRENGRTPCGTFFTQRMVIDCGSGEITYTTTFPKPEIEIFTDLVIVRRAEGQTSRVFPPP